MGLGHIRRNLLIAQALLESPLKPEIMLITGSPEAEAFSIPDGAGILTIPSLYKDENGNYSSRFLDLSINSIIELRSKTIEFAVRKFKPDIFIIDKVPRGVLGELDLTLKYLRTERGTRCILGLRDILDEPAVVKREWSQANNFGVIRNFYDAVWIYGDPSVYNAVEEYDFPADVGKKVRFTGYQDQRLRLHLADQRDVRRIISAGPYALCLVGGGQDGARLAETFARCNFPSYLNGVIVTGPHMPLVTRERLRDFAAKNPRLGVLEFVAGTGPLLSKAERIVAMGGYNTICEVLSYQKPALIVPRVVPRREQLIRAQRMQELGLVDLMPWESVTSVSISKWLSGQCERPDFRQRIDLNGLSRIPELLLTSEATHASFQTEGHA